MRYQAFGLSGVIWISVGNLYRNLYQNIQANLQGKLCGLRGNCAGGACQYACHTLQCWHGQLPLSRSWYPERFGVAQQTLAHLIPQILRACPYPALSLSFTYPVNHSTNESVNKANNALGNSMINRTSKLNGWVQNINTVINQQANKQASES